MSPAEREAQEITWCAIAQEGLGAYQEALRCYSRALGVAHIDRKAALAMTEQLKKKIALTELASFGSEEMTGLLGQRLEKSDFSTGVPYAASVVGMLSKKAPPQQHRAPPPLKIAERDRNRSSGGHRVAPQLGSGRRSAGRLHATLMGAASAAGSDPSECLHETMLLSPQPEGQKRAQGALAAADRQEPR